MKGIIVFKNRSQIVVENENGTKHICHLKGTVRHNYNEPIAGDYVEYDDTIDTKLIHRIYDRKTSLIRPKVANVDKVYIVQSTRCPDYNELLIDKMLVFYQAQGVDVSIIITKTDIYMDNEIRESIKNYNNFGIQTLDRNNKIDINILKDDIKNKLVCFVGNSGVGKSTLINELDPQLNLRTQETSKSLNRGKHTTTTTSIYNFIDGKIADSPGFSTVDIKYNACDIARIFFKEKITKSCKFNDCCHIDEKGCIVKDKMIIDKNLEWRYNNYLKLLKGVKND